MNADERDTGVVTGATPPPPPHRGQERPLPPPGSSSSSPPPPEGPPQGPPQAPTSRPSPVDWSRIAETAAWWYAPLRRRESWTAALYLLVGMFSAIGFFIVLVAFGAIVFALLFVGVGIFLVRPLFATAALMAKLERDAARWVGVDIEPRSIEPMSGLGLRALRDGERWRHIGFVLVNVLIGTLLGNVGLIGFVIVQQTVLNGGLFGTGFDPNPFTGFSIVFGLLVGAVALGAAPRIAVFVSGFKAQVTQWFLGVDELAAARRRVDSLATQRDDILEAVAGERRRIERNLHDGVQQQLVAIGLDLGMAEQSLDTDVERTRELIATARDKVRGSIGELRQLGRGLHPSILADRGIDAALSAVVAGAPIPISVHVDDDLDLGTDVAETIYFVANEAVANVLKHSSARVASIQVRRVAANVRVTVNDDGDGGVDQATGSGIAGMRARVQAVDGTLTISSPPGGPTSIVAEVPRVATRRTIDDSTGEATHQTIGGPRAGTT